MIVAAASVQAGMLNPDWVTTLTLAMALSFFVSTPTNSKVNSLYLRYRDKLCEYEHATRLPEEEISELGLVDTAVLGMGRVGRTSIVGVEESFGRANSLCDEGFHCVHGDAIDRDFRERTGLAKCELIVVDLSNHKENIQVVELAHALKYTGQLWLSQRNLMTTKLS